MPGLRAPYQVERNIHIVNADNDEIGGTWQNGSLTWAEMSEWMQIVFELPLNEYAPFPCLEDGDPKDPVAQHGAPINMHANTNHIQPGFYVLLNPQGKSNTRLISILINFRLAGRHPYQSRESLAPLCISISIKSRSSC
jgi:hypothetical protein